MKALLLREKLFLYFRISAIILSCLVMRFTVAKASFSELSFDIFMQREGLPNNQINCIYQDNRGWIWIGTDHGLSRFDGYSFRNFLPDPSNSNSLQGSIVRVIKEDSKGNLMIGTENGGLNVLNRETEQFSYLKSNFSTFRFRNNSSR